MGAFQALEWMIHYPVTVTDAVLLVPSWHHGPILKIMSLLMRDLVEADPNWSNGGYKTPPVKGLELAGRMYFPWTISDEYLENLSPSEMMAASQELGRAFAKWDAWNLLKRYEASSNHDVCQPFDGGLQEALSRVEARVLVMPCLQDRLLKPHTAEQIVTGIRNAHLEVIHSPKGHLAWRATDNSPEQKIITRTIRSFLNISAAS